VRHGGRLDQEIAGNGCAGRAYRVAAEHSFLSKMLNDNRYLREFVVSVKHRESRA